MKFEGTIEEFESFTGQRRFKWPTVSSCDPGAEIKAMPYENAEEIRFLAGFEAGKIHGHAEGLRDQADKDKEPFIPGYEYTEIDWGHNEKYFTIPEGHILIYFDAIEWINVKSEGDNIHYDSYCKFYLFKKVHETI